MNSKKGQSAESQFVRQLDRLEMALQASVYEHQGNQDLSIFFASANRSLSSVELKLILSKLEELRDNPKSKI